MALHTPQVSVLLPFYNAAGTIETAVNSIREQTFADWELLALDDGSTDEGSARVDCLARDDRRIRLIPLSHRGIVSALNRGIDEARAPLLARMDADDESHPQRLERQTAWMRAHPQHGLVSCLVEPGDSMQPGYARYVQWINSVRTPGEHAVGRFIESPLAHPSVLYRREWVRHAGGYRDGDFPEDYELWLRWMEAGLRMAKIPEVLFTWNDSPGRLSRTDPRYRRESFYQMKCQYLASWLAREVPPEKSFWLWGAGRITRQRFSILEQNFRPFDGFVDIDPRKTGNLLGTRPIVPPDAIPAGAFLLIGVGSRGAREQIVAWLEARKCVEGTDFLCVA